MNCFKNYLTIVIAVACFSANFLASAQDNRAVADNGREVILKDNGEWEYVSDDLYATTTDGQRIRLKPNNKWQKVSDGQAPIYQPVPIATIQRDNVQLGDTNITLDELHIENQRETVGKNKRLRSNLVFYIDLSNANSPNKTSATENILPNASQISVQDSRGKDYPVFSVTNGTSPIGGQSRLIVRAKGAPRWWGVKFFSIQLKTGAIGNSDTVELRKPLRDVVRKEVTQLPEDNL